MKEYSRREFLKRLGLGAVSAAVLAGGGMLFSSMFRPDEEKTKTKTKIKQWNANDWYSITPPRPLPQ